MEWFLKLDSYGLLNHDWWFCWFAVFVVVVVVVSEVKNHNASLKEHKRTFLGIRCTCKERTGGLVCIQKFCKELKMIGYLHSSALPLMSVKGAGDLFSFKHMLLTPDFQVTDLETTSPVSYLPLLICSPPLPCSCAREG